MLVRTTDTGSRFVWMMRLPLLLPLLLLLYTDLSTELVNYSYRVLLVFAFVVPSFSTDLTTESVNHSHRIDHFRQELRRCSCFLRVSWLGPVSFRTECIL